MIICEIELVTRNMCNDTAKKTDDVHRANISLNVINKRNTINKLNKTTAPAENEPRLEE